MVFRGFFKFLQKITPKNPLQNKYCSKSNIKGWQKKDILLAHEGMVAAILYHEWMEIV